MKNSILLIAFVLAFSVVHAQELTFSPIETVQVKESNVFWAAELDTVSAYTIINASSIAVMNASFPKEKNVTKQISFKLRNEEDKGRTVNGKVTGLANWNGQQLYTVELEIGINLSTRWEYRKVNCVLADLTENEHKLILGKNWVGNDMVVE